MVSPGKRMHTVLNACIVCSGPGGRTRINVEVAAHPSLPGETMLVRRGIGNTLCPRCKPKYLPLTPVTRKQLDDLSDKTWDDLRKRGCPCCEAGLTWHDGWGDRDDRGQRSQ
jgi:hypothetical protein